MLDDSVLRVWNFEIVLPFIDVGTRKGDEGPNCLRKHSTFRGNRICGDVEFYRMQ